MSLLLSLITEHNKTLLIECINSHSCELASLVSLGISRKRSFLTKTMMSSANQLTPHRKRMKQTNHLVRDFNKHKGIFPNPEDTIRICNEKQVVINEECFYSILYNQFGKKQNISGPQQTNDRSKFFKPQILIPLAKKEDVASALKFAKGRTDAVPSSSITINDFDLMKPPDTIHSEEKMMVIKDDWF